MSDHLPIYLEIKVDKRTSSIEKLVLENDLYYDAIGDQLVWKEQPLEPFDLVVFDLSGRQVMNKIQTSESLIQTTSLVKGTYFVQINGQKQAVKFVKS